jgi:hypothetical protein
MSVARCDRTLTDGEVRALVGPMFGLSLEDDFDVTIIVESRDNGVVHECIHTTEDDFGMIARASDR